VNAGPDGSVPMRHSGGQIYRGPLPGQVGGSMVEYWVTATDANDNTGTGPTLAFVVPDCGGVNDCSGHGTCTGVDVCDCDFGWEGPDCSEFNPVEGGEVPDGIAGSPLVLRKAAGGTARLFWDASCGVNDEDYAVYQGSVGDFTGHLPLTCSTGGATFLQFTPGAGDLYFLVVPTTANAEGSYGREADGTQRPGSAAPCAPQAFLACQ